MSKLIIGTIAAFAVVIVPAIAQNPQRDGAMATSMTRADIEARVKERFARIDADRNGSVTKSEIDSNRAAKMKERQDSHFTAMDGNKDGMISRAEFDAGHAGRKQGGGKHAGKRGFGHGKMFDRGDANADGTLSLAETMTKAMARFDAADANKDGTLTPDERKTARNARRAEWRAKRG